MTATAFERDARRFIDAYMRETTLKFGKTDARIDPKTKEYAYRTQFIKTVVDAVIDQKLGGHMAFSARSHPDSLDIIIQSSISPFTNNKLALYAKRDIMGYETQLNLYVGDNAMPITPVMRVMKDLITELDVHVLVADERTRDAHFYLGLTAPDLNKVQRIPIAEAADPTTQAYNQGTE